MKRLMLVLVLLVLTACGGGAVEPITPESTQAPQQAERPTQRTETSQPTDTPAPTDTTQPTDTTVPPTDTATPSSTNTLAPTETSRPTDTPEPAATLTSEPVSTDSGERQVTVDDIRWYKDDFGDLIFIGQVRNSGSASVENVKITVSLLDGEGKIVSTESSNTVLDVVSSGRIMPFKIDFLEDPGEFEDFETVVQADQASEHTLEHKHQQFEVTRKHIKPTEEKRFAVVLEAVNQHSEAAESVETAVVAYNEDGNVIGVGQGYAEQPYIQAGEAGTVNIGFSTLAPIADHAVFIEGQIIEDLGSYVQNLEVPTFSYYSDFFHDLIVVGEVVNGSDESVSSLDIAMTASDAEGNLLASASGDTKLAVIFPDEIAPFRIDFLEDVTNIASIKAEVYGKIAGDYVLNDVYREFEVVQHNEKATEPGYFALVGQIKNSGNEISEYVEVVVTAYDDAGEVIGVGSEAAELDTIEPDVTSPFEVEFEVTEEVADFKVQIEGRKKD